ncbi:helix-turn-helix domain-containing protein [Antrihabitans sp. YC3-6]|uniref:Helix-turn-helix domain-containing protein n=1 Tax=Antrihabitans stalagmiti TaxID=2799499 RepID=A0A934NT42_9NOCA|nr:helix-turn-helix domain-containing protein [Antrihabitans stalagmiti]MBJ8341038.1 helix-turn-helix domain-containing protein [Antrihabitans stalagmiti]
MSAQTQALETRTFLPEHLEELAPVLSFLEAHGQRGMTATPSYALVGTGEHERIELPQAVHQVLTQVVTALLAGKAVTVAPQSMTLTTQQAADLLGVSRPTVVRLITEGHLPAERVGNRHRILLDNVLVYRDARRQRQYDALAETSVDIDTEDDPATIREQLREAREAVARRRQAAKA